MFLIFYTVSSISIVVTKYIINTIDLLNKS